MRGAQRTALLALLLLHRKAPRLAPPRTERRTARLHAQMKSSHVKRAWRCVRIYAHARLEEENILSARARNEYTTTPSTPRLHARKINERHQRCAPCAKWRGKSVKERREGSIYSKEYQM